VPQLLDPHCDGNLALLGTGSGRLRIRRAPLALLGAGSGRRWGSARVAAATRGAKLDLRFGPFAVKLLRSLRFLAMTSRGIN
jgi:hypothetical protein